MPDDDRDFIRTRLRSGGLPPAAIVAALLAPVFLAVAGLLAVGLLWLRPVPAAGPAAPAPVAGVAANGTVHIGDRVTADREGVEWNHAELLAHLNQSHELGFVMFPDRPAFGGRGPSAYFVVKGTEHATSGAQAGVGFQYGYPEVLIVSVEPDARAARDAAGPHGDRAFAWGRFVVRSTEKGRDTTLAGVKKALGG